MDGEFPLISNVAINNGTIKKINHFELDGKNE